ncbi:MAG: phosphoribosylformylglycinamidine synthase [Eubacterium sp.]|jgi:phosphoribosylformylglycinamidine synthase|nr:phosphoribosylformylglycinamidine synthase [Eubacterium sp.]
MVYRVYVEKKPEFNIEGEAVKNDIITALLMDGITNVRIINRYDVEDISEESFKKCVTGVFSEPPVDDAFYELPELKCSERMFAVEYLPGQFDQRADSASQCVGMLCEGESPIVKSAKVYLLSGEISDGNFDKIKSYLINIVEARECGFSAYETLKTRHPVPEEEKTLDGFINLGESELLKLIDSMGLAMDFDDIKFCLKYFKEEEGRNPTVTEMRVIDTYWSDHCRHTTFGTHIENVEIDEDYIEESYKNYRADRLKMMRDDRPVTLMDIATMGMRKLRSEGLIPDLDESEEINACSVRIKVDINGEEQDWLLMFKNETHNHPTEIEPFGGAATCLGGAIRDPLSGRSYVYQAMRVTGSANPLRPISETIPGKLPSRKITGTAAAGYSSYGNQIGLATGLVSEIYHTGYMAKRMEIGAVIGATPSENVVRERPVQGDIIILLGGRTGRDGCGGATGSSKSHNLDSLETSGAEVQKGNAPEERKIQRLFRNGEVTRLIKRCNDFGAGGVSVAIGELADGLLIDLDKIPKKYDGLSGTELAISESQERMAVVVDKNSAGKFISFAESENLEATEVAEVTADFRLKMRWNGDIICDISRGFLNSNGAPKRADVKITKNKINYKSGIKTWNDLAADINICSQKGLTQRFDSTVGRGTILMPFGGKTQQTPAQVMAAKIPVLDGETDTASIMAWGFNPVVSEQSPFHGAALAVVESVSKIVAAGGKSKNVRLTFQEYFERLRNDPERWGKPFAALLGAYDAQKALGIPAIGGKDSMSGSFEDIDVPPTLVSFAVVTAKSERIISPEFKRIGSKVCLLSPDYDKNLLPDYTSVKQVFEKVEREIENGNAISAWTLTGGGVAEGLFKMCLGNNIGVNITADVNLFDLCYGAFILETKNDVAGAELIGETIGEYDIVQGGMSVDISNLETKWNSVLEPVFKNNMPKEKDPAAISFKAESVYICKPEYKNKEPLVLIPAFAGTNGEYDMAEAFKKEGARTEIFVIRNLTSIAIAESIAGFAARVDDAQIIALPGGFSAGDEPEGSGKFITAFFSNEKIKNSVHRLLHCRDGLILGICNGFQALIKLGLVPYGEIREMSEESPTLTFNKIGHHQSQIVNIKVCSNNSPWLKNCNVGEVYSVPISHGEGRFAANGSVVSGLVKNGQIATQYVDLNGNPTMDTRFNPNGSIMAAECALSPDGRVLGKMGHIERVCVGFAANIHGNKNMPLIKAGVEYFR